MCWYIFFGVCNFVIDCWCASLDEFAPSSTHTKLIHSKRRFICCEGKIISRNSEKTKKSHKKDRSSDRQWKLFKNSAFRGNEKGFEGHAVDRFHQKNLSSRSYQDSLKLMINIGVIWKLYNNKFWFMQKYTPTSKLNSVNSNTTLESKKPTERS